MGVNLFIWDKFIGALVRTPEGIAFEYDPQFKKSNLNLSPINLPLSGKNIFINESEWKATEGIPGVIYDSLPDRFGNKLLEIYFNDKGLTEKDIDVFSKLQYIGSRGMGAIEYRPAEETPPFNESISLAEIERISLLSDQGKNALKTNLKDKEALLKILHVGTSAGGARAKALIAINKKNGEIKHGQLSLGSDYEYFILKIDGANTIDLAEPSGFGRLEYTYYQMAIDCHIKMTESSLYNDTHFLTKRFDRDSKGEKIHVHSLCGILGIDYNQVGQYSYEQYFMTARRIDLGQDSMEEIYRRMVFNVLTHNCDDHCKNFSFMMDKKGGWSLSPAFDICYSYDSANSWVNGHNMTVNKKRKHITWSDLMTVGEKFNIKKRHAIFKKTNTIVDNFKTYAQKNNVKPELIAEVEKNRPTLSEPQH